MANEQKNKVLSPQEIVEKTTIADVYRAVKNLDGVIRKTKLIHSDYFSELSHNDVYIKPENLQKTGSFKLRGAYNCISQLTDEQKAHGVIAASAGNHAQGVAYAAQKLGVKAVITMPATTPLLKVEATRAYGAEVVLSGDDFDAAAAKAVELQKQYNYTFIHPFKDIEVILGQGTTALEIIDDLKDVDAILVPVGGGGFVSGVAVATKMVNPHVKVIGVEPCGAACVKESLQENKIITLPSVDTVAEGTAVKTPGDVTFEFIKKYVDDVITVSEFEIMSALLSLIEKHKLIAEGAGVLSLAASRKLPFKGKKVAAIVSGGNIDISTISALIDADSLQFGHKSVEKENRRKSLAAILLNGKRSSRAKITCFPRSFIHFYERYCQLRRRHRARSRSAPARSASRQRSCRYARRAPFRKSR